MVPGVARVTRRGTSITGVLGEVTQANSEVDDQARAFVRALVASGQVRTAPQATRRLAAPPQPRPDVPQKTPSHEIRVIAGEPTLVRVGFACR
jgi:hypothetical protein